MTITVKKWLWAVLLPLPLYALFISHYISALPGDLPTGFMQLDTPLYAAKIRQIAEAPDIRMLYAPPCYPFYVAPRIYFQLHIVMLGLFSRFANIPAYYLIILFHLAASILFARLAIQVIDMVSGFKNARDWIILVLFFWGGGAICSGGIIVSLVTGHGIHDALLNAFMFDPGQGWWFMNLGRNVVLPIEAYYHVLALGVLVMVLKGWFRVAVIICLLLCMSHVVTAFQVVGIVLAWALLERYFIRNTLVPGYFIGACILLLTCLVYYYLVYLNQFVEHRQWTPQAVLSEWQVDAKHFIPAYALVAGMAFWQFRTLDHARVFFSNSIHRLFLVWALGSFILENHEFLGVAIEPAHFARGYAWMGMFLMGVPTLRSALDRISNIFNSPSKIFIIICLILIFMFDNILWFSAVAYERRYIHKNKGDFYLNKPLIDVLHFLQNNPGVRDSVVIAEDPLLGYMTIVYTSLRSWASHHGETVGYETRRKEIETFFKTGVCLPEWTNSPSLAISTDTPATQRSHAWIAATGTNILYRNAGYTVYRLPSGR